MTLTAAVALQGSNSALSRFSYQVVALVNLVSPIITGTISFSGMWLWPDASKETLAGNLNISANLVVPPPPGELGGTLEPVGESSVTQVIGSATAAAVSVTYQIVGVPFGQVLQVTVDPDSMFTPTVPGQVIVSEQVSGPVQFTLTPSAPTQECDFVLTSVFEAR